MPDTEDDARSDENGWVDEDDPEEVLGRVLVDSDGDDDEEVHLEDRPDAAQMLEAMLAQSFPGLRDSASNSTILSALSQLLDARRLFSPAGLRGGDEDEDRRGGQGWSADPTTWYDQIEGSREPGLDLLKGGEFGRVGLATAASSARTMSLQKILMQRQMNMRSMDREELARPLIPNSNGTVVARYDSNPYAGQYSNDSSFYYTCEQGFKLHVYDTSDAPSEAAQTNRRYPDHPTTLKCKKSIQAVAGSWTITDSHLSPDNQRLIYASITPTVYMTKLWDPVDEQIPIHFADQTRNGYYSGGGFGIWSCRFSADGNEIVAGGSGQLFVYDLLSMKRTVRIPAHSDDVNSCCWADPHSGNILISGSDDTFIKVWDRRSLSHYAKPAGVLVGHTEGITYVSSKGDGRYVISNGKDQSLRLWDLRKMRSNEEFEELPNRNYGFRGGYDYRNGVYRRPQYDAHPNDCSVMTYRGHAVLRTLIRCHFSPTETTGGNYIYSGSLDGKIHVWSLDGRVVQVLDRALARPMPEDPSAPEPEPSARHAVRGRPRSSGCVRDVSWHSGAPAMMSVAWESDRENGSVALHEWKGYGKNAMSLEDVVERERLADSERTQPPGYWDYE